MAPTPIARQGYGLFCFRSPCASGVWSWSELIRFQSLRTAVFLGSGCAGSVRTCPRQDAWCTPCFRREEEAAWWAPPSPAATYIAGAVAAPTSTASACFWCCAGCCGVDAAGAPHVLGIGDECCAEPRSAVYLLEHAVDRHGRREATSAQLSVLALSTTWAYAPACAPAAQCTAARPLPEVPHIPLQQQPPKVLIGAQRLACLLLGIGRSDRRAPVVRCYPQLLLYHARVLLPTFCSQGGHLNLS